MFKIIFQIIIIDQSMHFSINSTSYIHIIAPNLSIREYPFNHRSAQISMLSPLAIFLSINPLHHFLVPRSNFHVYDVLLFSYADQKFVSLQYFLCIHLAHKVSPCINFQTNLMATALDISSIFRMPHLVLQTSSQHFLCAFASI